MSSVVPSMTDNVVIVTPQTLTRGSVLRATIDLRTKVGAWAYPKIGRGGTTALAAPTMAGIDVLFNAVMNNDVATPGGGGSTVFALMSSTAAAVATTVNADSASGQNVLNVASITGFATQDWICIQDSGGVAFTRLEFAKISKLAAGAITLNRNLQYAHTAVQADTVRNKADVFNRVWLEGGSLWSVHFDYGEETAGDTAIICCLAQTVDYYSIV